MGACGDAVAPRRAIVTLPGPRADARTLRTAGRAGVLG